MVQNIIKDIIGIPHKSKLLKLDKSNLNNLSISLIENTIVYVNEKHIQIVDMKLPIHNDFR